MSVGNGVNQGYAGVYIQVCICKFYYLLVLLGNKAGRGCGLHLHVVPKHQAHRQRGAHNETEADWQALARVTLVIHHVVYFCLMNIWLDGKTLL